MSTAAAAPWADATERLARGVESHPYLTLLAAGGLGCLLAGGVARRLLPELAGAGLRVALAAALPGLASVLRDAGPQPRA